MNIRSYITGRCKKMAETFFDKIYKNKTLHTPDVLSCLANLSNDEVFTPPDVVNRMLDLLPQDLFQDPNTTFLDPACKTGVFLREIAKRLLIGLQDKIPDLQKRIDHIFHKQLFGIAITELTSLLSRRSLYCSKYPNGDYSVSHFDTAEGNIRFRRTEHTWVGDKCKFCGANKSYDRGDGKETHAYEFIHTITPEKIFNMKFDVIISNPPYQLNTGGTKSQAIPLYHKFVEQAQKLEPRYVLMIIPARWYAGGMGLDQFRCSMLNDSCVRCLVDYTNSKDCFPGVSLGGGVCYFLWDNNYNGPCKITNIHNKNINTAERSLNEFPVFVRYNEAIAIIRKISTQKEKLLPEIISSLSPFGLESSVRGGNSPADGEIKVYSSQGIGYLPAKSIKQGNDLLNAYKIMLSKVTSEHASEADKNGQFKVFTKIQVLQPNEACTFSYFVLGNYNNVIFAQNLLSYLKTKFVRFLVLQCVSSINLSKDKFQFVPMQDFSKPWTDEELYKKYNLSQEEIDFIESMIKPME